MLSENQEEILEALWVAGESNLQSREDIKKICAVDMTEADVLFLEQRGLIIQDGENINLSDDGKILAEAIIRRHRLAEVLVSCILQLKKADMEKVACKVEHSLLPEVEESICTLLGHPEVCPDGKPIPRGRCCTRGQKIINRAVVKLSELQASESGKITYIKPITHSNFHQLIAFGVHPGVIVTVHRKAPTLCIKFENTELALGDEIADNIFVWRITENNGH